MNSRRSQRLDEQYKQAQIAQLMGYQSPLQSLSGLVNILNSIQSPMIQQEQFGQELGLKRDEMAQRQGIAEREFGQREAAQQFDMQKFADEMTFRKGQQQDENAYRKDVLAGRADEANMQREYQTGVLGEQAKQRQFSAFAHILGSLLGVPTQSKTISQQIDALSSLMGLPKGIFGEQANGGVAQQWPGMQMVPGANLEVPFDQSLDSNVVFDIRERKGLNKKY